MRWSGAPRQRLEGLRVRGGFGSRRTAADSQDTGEEGARLVPGGSRGLLRRLARAFRREQPIPRPHGVRQFPAEGGSQPHGRADSVPGADAALRVAELLLWGRPAGNLRVGEHIPRAVRHRPDPQEGVRLQLARHRASWEAAAGVRGMLLLLPFVGVRDADHAPRADHRDTGVSLLRDLLVPEGRRLPHGFLCGDRGHEVQPSSCRRSAAVLQAAQAVLHHRVCAVRRALHIPDVLRQFASRGLQRVCAGREKHHPAGDRKPLQRQLQLLPPCVLQVGRPERRDEGARGLRDCMAAVQGAEDDGDIRHVDAPCLLPDVPGLVPRAPRLHACVPAVLHPAFRIREGEEVGALLRHGGLPGVFPRPEQDRGEGGVKDRGDSRA